MIHEALNQFHRDSHKFADVAVYHAKAEEYGRPDIFTCQDMLSDENTLREAARKRYVENTGTEVEDRDLDYHWVAGLGSDLRCTKQAFIPAVRVPRSWKRAWTADDNSEDEDPLMEILPDLRDAYSKRIVNSNSDRWDTGTLLEALEKLEAFRPNRVKARRRASSASEKDFNPDLGPVTLSTQDKNAHETLDQLSLERDKAEP